ncbi:MAG: helix-turn-helix transcriptional regulator [Pseudomonadota bacterium]
MNSNNPINSVLFNDRELEVLRYVLQGLSNKEVARRLDRSPRTVDRYIEIVRFKLRAKNRTHMVARALSAGLLEVTEHSRTPNVSLAD